MIDLHCHLLPGIDDGPQTMEDALALACALVAGGVGTVVATPHASPAFANSGAGVARAVAAMEAALTEAGVPLRVLRGAEIDLLQAVDRPDEELRELALGDGGWLLVEAPLRLHPHVERNVRELLVRGHRVLLAHPERSPAFQHDPAALRRLVHDGVPTQVTAGSLVGRFGRTVRGFAAQIVDEGLVHVAASDAHDLAGRPPGMRAELTAAGLESQIAWLTDEVPAALLAGADVPAPPPSRRSVRRWRPRRRPGAR